MNNTLNSALRHEMAFAFWDDARDLLALFEFTWRNKENFTKTGRIKIVLNLIMACECALKAHVILSNNEMLPKNLLGKIKNASHNIKKLCEAANYMQDRTTYDALAPLLECIGVEIRYSLNASHTYFRSSDTYAFYDKTIADESWITSIKYHLNVLIDECQPILTNSEPISFDLMISLEKEFNNLMKNKSGQD